MTSPFCNSSNACAPSDKARACVQSSATYSFELPDGIYAISVYIDVNLNNKLVKNFVGIPKEPYAFSNNAEGFLGSPSFENASFVIAGDTSLSIDM